MSLDDSIQKLREALSDAHLPESSIVAQKALVDLFEGMLQEIRALRDKIEAQNKKLEELASFCARMDSELDELEEAVEDLYEYYEGEEDEQDFYESAICPECDYTFMFNPSLFEEGEILICPNCGRFIDQGKLNK
ncbi:MAG TPA: hypothetical protein PLR17_00635 [Acetomicrobium flavidum]|uniref:hypothetical protein n=1 Tax=Acetomicrobium flavidum TaxID=49896 RepID=UPI002C61304B|nr:hypothetical protein [Acetomicrobium flavidum]HOM30870.1 hypothetical protein [Acetomicrobium flavidum]HPP14101.1 hypothetical protein [Acetomicrobium flavidum]